MNSIPDDIIFCIVKYTGKSAINIDKRFNLAVKNNSSRIVSNAVRRFILKSKAAMSYPDIFKRNAIRIVLKDMPVRDVKYLLVNTQFNVIRAKFISIFQNIHLATREINEELVEGIVQCLLGNREAQDIDHIDPGIVISSAVHAFRKYKTILNNMSVYGLINHISEDTVDQLFQ